MNLLNTKLRYIVLPTYVYNSTIMAIKTHKHAPKAKYNSETLSTELRGKIHECKAKYNRL